MLTDHVRQEYKQAASLTDKQIEEALGEMAVPRTAALAPEAATTAQSALRELMVDLLIISARYNEVSRKTKKDARQVVAPDELQRDREALEAVIADEYHLTNPFGKSEGKQETINKILSGTIRPDSFGQGGFKSPEHTLQVHAIAGRPHTAVSHGRLIFKGAGSVKFKKSGAVRWRDLTGEYRTTHTYIFRDGRWQVTASQMTQLPEKQTFAFVGEK